MEILAFGISEPFNSITKKATFFINDPSPEWFDTKMARIPVLKKTTYFGVTKPAGKVAINCLEVINFDSFRATAGCEEIAKEKSHFDKNTL